MAGDSHGYGCDLFEGYPVIGSLGHDFEHRAEEVVPVAQGVEGFVVEPTAERRAVLVSLPEQPGRLFRAAIAEPIQCFQPQAHVPPAVRSGIAA